MAVRRKGKTGPKGFVLTVDSIIALGFAVGLISFMASASRTGPSIFTYAVSVQNYAEGISNVLDESGVLKASMAQSDGVATGNIQAVLNQTLPTNYGAYVNVSTYQYQPSGQCTPSCQLQGASPINSFCLCRLYSAISYSPNGVPNMNNVTNVGSAYRIFYTNTTGSEIYGIAKVLVWVN